MVNVTSLSLRINRTQLLHKSSFPLKDQLDTHAQAPHVYCNYRLWVTVLCCAVSMYCSTSPRVEVPNILVLRKVIPLGEGFHNTTLDTFALTFFRRLP